MTMKLHLKRGRSVILISAYAPTMSNDDADKEAFCDNRNSVLWTVFFKDRLFLLGDFNARVGRDAETWLRVLGQHSVGNENSNGSLLLQTCSEHELAITNTYFQQANKYKTTWQHPRSKHWHMMDHVITRQRHLKEVHSTRAMEGTGMLDHRLVRSLVALELPPPRRRQAVRRRKLNVSKLREEDMHQELQESISQRLQHPEQQTANSGRHALYSPSVDERQELLGQEDGLHSSETEGAAQAP